MGPPDVPLKFGSRLLPDGWAELKISGGRCYIRALQPQLDNLGTSTKNFEFDSEVEKLQPFDVGWISG